MKTRLHPAVAVLAMATLVFLYLPMAAVAVFSLNASRVGLVWKGFTLQWYVNLFTGSRTFDNGPIIEAARNTLILAVVSTVVSTVLGTLLAIGISRFPWGRRIRAMLDLLVYLPVVTPDIIFAAALVVAFGVLQGVFGYFQPGMLTMIIAHVTFQVAFVTLVVHSRLATFGRSLEEAARDLYADSWYLLRRVTLPMLMPAIAAGAMLAFTLSLDDFVISFFTAGPESTTLPLLIRASVKRGITPEIHALSTLIFLVTVVLVLVLERLTRLGTGAKGSL